MSTQGGSHISIREYARRRGVSDAAVRKWIAAGRIQKCADGKIDPEMADADVAASVSGAQVSPLAERAGVPVLAMPLALPLQEPEKPSRADAERELAEIKAERARIMLDREKGESVPVAEVEAAVGELIAAAKGRLLLVPHKVADELARTTDPLACRNIVEHAIREALQDLSGYQVAA